MGEHSEVADGSGGVAERGALGRFVGYVGQELRRVTEAGLAAVAWEWTKWPQGLRVVL